MAKKADNPKKPKGPRRIFRQRSTASEPGIIVLREYYQIPFGVILNRICEEGRYSPRFSSKRSAFWKQVVPGRYQTEEAQALLDGYARSLEDRLEQAIGSQSIAYWVHLFRRLAPTPIGRDPKPMTVFLTRSVLDAAIQKWGRAELCDRVSESDRVPASSILQGLVERHDRGILSSLKSQPQLVLTAFGPAEYVDALETEKLAYEVWRTMAMRRVVAKGADLVVGDHDELVRDDRSDELDQLVRSYDERSQGLSATATVFNNLPGGSSGGRILLPRYNSHRLSFESVRPLFERITGSRFETPQDGGGPNFAWIPFDLLNFYRAHLPFREAFRQMHGLSLESVVGLVGSLGDFVLQSWMAQPFHFMLRHWQRAYDGPATAEQLHETLTELLPGAMNRLQFPFAAEDVDLGAAIGFFTLDDERRDVIGLRFAGPHQVFLPAGNDRILVDYAYLVDRLYHLFFRLEVADQNFKGSALEFLTHRGKSVLPIKRLNAKDGSSRQVDAAFDLGDILVIAECRAKARSIGFDNGDSRALEVRRKLVEKAIEDIDEKARWLKDRKKGLSYDVSRFKCVLPIGVSPFVEFIPSLHTRYWVGRGLPRILTPEELDGAISDGSLATATRSSPDAVFLGGD